MFFITRLTENTNLAVSIPPSEQIFNAARVNIQLARSRFAELDITSKHRPNVAQSTSQQPPRTTEDEDHVTSSLSKA